VGGGGPDARDGPRLQALEQTLAEQLRGGDAAEQEAKQALRSNTDAAVAAGVFGVPSMVLDGKLFWGFDGLPMLSAYLNGDAWFADGQWDASADRPSGLAKR